MAAQSVVPKDPGDTLDYIVNWARWLAVGETISAATFTTAAGITKGTVTNTTTTATVRLSGGTAGVSYNVMCQITTSTGQIVQRSFYVAVEER